MRCGIVFAKFYKMKAAEAERGSIPACSHAEPTLSAKPVKKLLFYVEPHTNPFFLTGRSLVLLVLAVWGAVFILTPLETNYSGNSFWHLINLPFHEAGHIFFRPFGAFLMSLGGTLGQLLMPAICFSVFLFKSRDTFGASVCLWWTGESFMDIAPYINDARNLQLMLLGGVTGREARYGYHDWEFILGELGLLKQDHLLAWFSYKLGSLLMILALVWGAYLLFRQYKNLG